MTPLRRVVFRSLLAALALAGVACGRPYVVATPPGFVEFEERYDGDEYRAATADGVVLGARSFDNEPKGELSFWVRAIQNRLRDQGGYALLESRPVRDRTKTREGTLLRFGHDEGKEPHLYYVAIFVTPDHVYVLEAGGTKSQIERTGKQIDWWVSSFLPD
jgi:hypothetical protein